MFILCEHVEGTTLDRWLDEHGLAPLPSAIDLAYRVCGVLNAAHRNGLAHAALYPRSLIVLDPARPTRELHARIVAHGVPSVMLAASPPKLHAASFMAPEQLEIALRPLLERSEPTVRMNVYGCGALLYYLCTGGPPFPSASIDELRAAYRGRGLVPASRINPLVMPELDALLEKALELEPRKRYRTTADLASALINIRFERATSRPPPSVVAPAPPEGALLTGSLSDVLDRARTFEDRPTSEMPRLSALMLGRGEAPATASTPP
jgi:serine/threonine-protein kinase